jgi:hypothetical protein
MLFTSSFFLKTGNTNICKVLYSFTNLRKTILQSRGTNFFDIPRSNDAGRIRSFIVTLRHLYGVYFAVISDGEADRLFCAQLT